MGAGAGIDSCIRKSGMGIGHDLGPEAEGQPWVCYCIGNVPSGSLVVSKLDRNLFSTAYDLKASGQNHHDKDNHHNQDLDDIADENDIHLRITMTITTMMTMTTIITMLTIITILTMTA